MQRPQYLLVINHVVSSVFKSVEELNKRPEFANLQVLLITTQPNLIEKYAKYIEPRHIIISDFESGVTEALEPFAADIVGVVCRGDKHIQYLRKLQPHLPSQVLVASVDSLEAATNKRLMRRDFLKHYPEITPKFIQVFDDSVDTIEEVEVAMEYPVIVKPANLFSSLLIHACADRIQLKEALKKTFTNVEDAYSKEGIAIKPQVIVEEYLDGDFYSIDAFVMDSGEVYCCPPVFYLPAKKIGVDDFFLYKRTMPSGLDEEETAKAAETTKKAVNAIGLTHSAVHM
ncbi:MAG: ATP-grasp domain-containing protein, partial [Bryobacteraceae bacterium]